jgi:hypothetical protein
MSFIKLPQLITPVFSVIAVLITSCASNTSAPQGQECARFKTGIFKYKTASDIRIERTETQQIEYNLTGDGGYLYTDKYAITWTSDCEYYLTLESTDHPEDLDFTDTDTMWCKITKVGRKGYEFIAVKDTTTYQGELVITAI